MIVNHLLLKSFPIENHWSLQRLRLLFEVRNLSEFKIYRLEIGYLNSEVKTSFCFRISTSLRDLPCTVITPKGEIFLTNEQ